MNRAGRHALWFGVAALVTVLVTVLPTKPAGGAEESAIHRLDQAVTALERRIARLHDADAIENLIATYGYFQDKMLWDEVAKLFSEQGSIEISQRGVYVGRRRIRESLELYGAQYIRAGYLRNHLQLQPVIHVAEDGRTAMARARALSMLGTHGENAMWGDSVYEYEFINENGRWYILRDHLHTTFFANYAGGWTRAPIPAAGVNESIPPDLPPSADYAAFPGVYVPPYHYANPVSGRSAGSE